MSELLHTVQHANQKLGTLVDMLAADEERVRITPEHLSILLWELLRVGEKVQNEGVSEEEPELSMALDQYRNLLERLRDLLPSLQACLLTERARLEAERCHLESAHAWAETSRYTG